MMNVSSFYVQLAIVLYAGRLEIPSLVVASVDFEVDLLSQLVGRRTMSFVLRVVPVSLTCPGKELENRECVVTMRVSLLTIVPPIPLPISAAFL